VKRFVLLAALAVIASLIASPEAGARPAPAPIAGEVQTIAFGSRTVELTVEGSPGDEEWAQRLTDLVIAGGPALEELIGVPFPGPDAMTISERTSEQLSGYAGMAGCSHVVCGIRLLANFDDTTLLHELTHAWTQSFRNRWLAEGMAEYISDRAAARIDGRIIPVAEPAGDRPPFPLLDWMLTIDFNSAEEEQISNEYEGYVWSRRFFEQLEATVGRDALRRTMAAVVPLQPGTVGVRRFMDAVDEAGGVPADDLFIRYVFPPERESEIRDRQTARDRLSALSGRAAAEAPELSQDVFISVRERMAAWEFTPVINAVAYLEEGLNAYLALRDRLPALRSAAEQAGLSYPSSLQSATATWNFTPFLEKIDDATPAIEAYAAAKQKHSEPRSLWQRIGLIGKSPESHLESASTGFASANFTQSIDESHAADAALADANSRALVNAALGAVILVLLLLSAGFLLRWAITEQRSPSTA
jgi:hypothetical protein